MGNTVTDITARTDIHIDTDHYLLEANINVKLKGDKKDNEEPAKRYYKPNPDEHRHYNKHIHDWFTNKSEETQQLPNYDEFVTEIIQAGEKTERD